MAVVIAVVAAMTRVRGHCSKGWSTIVMVRGGATALQRSTGKWPVVSVQVTLNGGEAALVVDFV